jgi:predicted nucleic acid-binding protein
MLVLDASVAVAWLFDDERTPEVVAVGETVCEGGAYVPPHWELEVANSLLYAARRGRCRLADVGLSLDRLNRLGIEPSPHQADTKAVVELADRRGLTVYDAAYLRHAAHLGLPLATLDQDLRAAARAEGVGVLPEDRAGRDGGTGADGAENGGGEPSAAVGEVVAEHQPG